MNNYKHNITAHPITALVYGTGTVTARTPVLEVSLTKSLQNASIIIKVGRGEMSGFIEALGLPHPRLFRVHHRTKGSNVMTMLYADDIKPLHWIQVSFLSLVGAA